MLCETDYYIYIHTYISIPDSLTISMVLTSHRVYAYWLANQLMFNTIWQYNIQYKKYNLLIKFNLTSFNYSDYMQALDVKWVIFYQVKPKWLNIHMCLLVNLNYVREIIHKCLHAYIQAFLLLSKLYSGTVFIPPIESFSALWEISLFNEANYWHFANDSKWKK